MTITSYTDEGWATNRVAPGKVILGNLDGIEAGVRQMIRKAFLVVRRNQTRDYLDPYRRLRKRWSDWSAVTDILGEVATAMASR